MSLKQLSAGGGDLTPEVISIGTCRALRIRRIGLTYMVENNHLSRDGVGATSDNWKVVAVVKPDQDPKKPSAHVQAHRWLADANEKVFALMDEDMRRSEAAAARGTN